MDNAGDTKPSNRDRLTTARTLAYERNDVDAAVSAEASLARRCKSRRNYRHRSKNRKRAIRHLRNFMDRSTDPLSGDENGNGFRAW